MLLCNVFSAVILKLIYNKYSLNFSVLSHNLANMNSYNPLHKKYFKVLSHFQRHKGSSDHKF